jgi:hypothetical protein
MWIATAELLLKSIAMGNPLICKWCKKVGRLCTGNIWMAVLQLEIATLQLSSRHGSDDSPFGANLIPSCHGTGVVGIRALQHHHSLSNLLLHNPLAVIMIAPTL